MIRSINQSGTVGKAKKRHTGVFGVDPLTEDAGTRLPCRLVKVVFHTGPLDQEVCERLGWIRDRYSPVRVDPKHNGGSPVRPVGVLCTLLPSSVSGHLSPHYGAEISSEFDVYTLLVRGLPCHSSLIKAHRTNREWETMVMLGRRQFFNTDAGRAVVQPALQLTLEILDLVRLSSRLLAGATRAALILPSGLAGLLAGLLLVLLRTLVRIWHAEPPRRETRRISNRDPRFSFLEVSP